MLKVVGWLILLVILALGASAARDYLGRVGQDAEQKLAEKRAPLQQTIKETTAVESDVKAQVERLKVENAQLVKRNLSLLVERANIRKEVADRERLKTGTDDELAREFERVFGVRPRVVKSCP